MLVAKAQVAAAAGQGTGRKGLRREAVGLAAAVAATLPSGSRECERLKQAACSRNFARTTLRRVHASGMAPVAEHKASPLSRKRAEASEPGRHVAFVEKMQAQHKLWRAAGLFTGDEPDADQMFNGDAWGAKPEGARARPHTRTQNRNAHAVMRFS
jgi:hypothetical protein